MSIRPPEAATTRVKIGPNVFATGLLQGQRVPAILRLHCLVTNGECTVAATAAAQNATLTLPWKDGQVRFLIEQVFPSNMRAAFPSVASVRVRFVADSTILNVIKVGDADVSGTLIDADRAILTELGSDRQTVTSIVYSETLLRIGRNVQTPALAFTGTLRVPVVFTPAGWSYKDRPLKVGGSFLFETAAGAMSGWVLDMAVQ
jgi:hypothetical protein